MTFTKWINYEMFVRYCGYNKYIIETFPDEVDALDDILTQHIDEVPYDFSIRRDKLEFLDYIDGHNIEIVPSSQYKGKIIIHYDKSEV